MIMLRCEFLYFCFSHIDNKKVKYLFVKRIYDPLLSALSHGEKLNH